MTADALLFKEVLVAQDEVEALEKLADALDLLRGRFEGLTDHDIRELRAVVTDAADALRESGWVWDCA